MSKSRRCVALAIACLVLAAPGWASALELGGVSVDPISNADNTPVPPVLDPTKPVTDVVDDVVDKAVGGLPDPVKDPVQEVVDGVIEPVREITDPATDKVETIVDRVRNGATVVPPPANDTVVRPSGGQVTTHPTAPRTRERARPRAEAPPVDRRVPTADIRAARAATDPAPRIIAAPKAPQRSAAEGLAQAVVEASRQFRFPLLLGALVLLFLGIQNRIDSRDPKLAAATEEEELVFA